jgi:hypothetical protein
MIFKSNFRIDLFAKKCTISSLESVRVENEVCELGK